MRRSSITDRATLHTSEDQPPAGATEPSFVLSQAQVCQHCGFSASHLDRLRRTDPSFPKPLVLGPRRIGWLREEVLGWLRHSARRADEKGRPISANQPPGSAGQQIAGAH